MGGICLNIKQVAAVEGNVDEARLRTKRYGIVPVAAIADCGTSVA
jgi:hypothetical protein